MSVPLRLGIDIDEVIYPLMDVCRPYFEKEFGVDLPLEDIDQYDLRPYGIDIQRIFEKYPHVLMKGKMDPFDQRVLHNLQNEGKKLYFISSRTPEQLVYSVNWLQHYGIKPEVILHTNQKHRTDREHGLHLFVDDHPDNFKGMRHAKKLLMDRPWNRDSTQYKRIHSMADFYREVKEYEGGLERKITPFKR